MLEEEELRDTDEQDLYEHLRVVVDKGQSLLRIDKFLMHRIENASRNRIQSAIEAGSVLVNEKIVKSSYKVKPMDVISVVLPHPPRDTEVYPEDIPLNIIYEDNDVLVINKPAGMVVHPGYNNYFREMTAGRDLYTGLIKILQDFCLLVRMNVLWPGWRSNSSIIL